MSGTVGSGWGSRPKVKYCTGNVGRRGSDVRREHRLNFRLWSAGVHLKQGWGKQPRP